MYKPHFDITNNILANISRIEAAREVIKNAPMVPLWERRFKKEAVERSVHYATALEGNPLNFTEVKEILDKGEKHNVIARERDIQEVINYRDALDYIEEVSEKEGQINEETIKELNAVITKNIVEDDYRGEFRKTEAYSRNSQTMEKVLEWPAPEKVSELVKELCNWAAEDAEKVNRILKAGILHTWLVLIHPFYDGNGRTSRILATLSLTLEGYGVKDLFSMEEYYDRDAAHYYGAIKSVWDSEGDYTHWLEYFTLGLAVEYNRIKERVLKLSRDAHLKESAGQVRLNPRQEKIILFVNDYGQIKNKDWQELFPDYSDDTILRDIRELVEKGVLVKRGKTKAARYEFP